MPIAWIPVPRQQSRGLSEGPVNVVPMMKPNQPNLGSALEKETVRKFRVQMIPVSAVRPEDGLGRRRDRAGHLELCRSIERFGVLTPITVRHAQDGTREYLLIKGQGRTLACRQLGLEQIPAIVVDSITEAEKVQHFLLENVARLRMRPIDRALLIARARNDGEETVQVARRFGVSAATVRKLEGLLRGISREEAAVLTDGGISIAIQSALMRFIPADERLPYLKLVSSSKISSGDLERLFVVLGWPEQLKLGATSRESRFQLFEWALLILTSMPKLKWEERVTELSLRLPVVLDDSKEATG